MGSDQSLAEDDWTTVALDTTNFDTRSELDTTANTFSPDSSGKYIISLSVEFEVGADQDGLWVVFVDDSKSNPSSNPKISARAGASGTRNHFLFGNGVVALDESVDYALKARNIDSGDLMVSTRTVLQIRSAF